MNNRNNQIKTKIIKSYGKGDDDTLIKFSLFLRELGIDFIKEPYILLDQMYGSLLSIKASLTEEEVRDKRFIIHHPDFLLRTKHGFVLLEIDGHWHNIKTKRTDERNFDYKMAKLDSIIINTDNLDEQKINPFVYLKEQLQARRLI